MPIRIAFWNINTGEGSFDDRIFTFQAWCAANNPDLLLLEEVSHTIGKDLPGWTGMSSICNVETLDKNFKPSTKELWALQSANAINNWNFQGRVSRFPDLVAKRGLLRLTMKISNPAFKHFELWVIHANASTSGGAAAVRAVKEHLDKSPDAVVGGDFNCPIGNAAPEACAPISWEPNNINLNFTQWDKSDGKTNGPNTFLHLPTKPFVQPVIYKKIEPHNVIDYVMLGRTRQALPRVNCANGDEAMWRDILTFFDHCPVVYDLS